MLDAIESGALLFEPHEIATLRAAYAKARGRVADSADTHNALATIVLNLARSRLRLKKTLHQPRDVRDLADDAIELFDYLRLQNIDASPLGLPRPADRPIGLFPVSFAAPVRTSFRYAAP